MSDADQKPLTHDEATQPVTKRPDADFEAWQNQQTQMAFSEADSGDFAAADDMKATIRKFVPCD